MRRAVAVTLSLCLAPAALAAQDRGGRPGLARAGAAREEAFRMVDAYLLSNLQESLGLSDAQYVKLLPLVKTHQAERRAAQQRRLQSLGELRRELRGGGATEARVGALLAEVKRAESDGPAAVARNLQAIDAMLSPVQQAKYRVLEAEVEQKVRELLRRAAREGVMSRRGRRGGPRPAEPEGEPDLEP